jgi:ribosomal protein S18 acetylase RimI-like enzyme
MRPARPDDFEWFYALRREGFAPYVDQVFGPWDDAYHRPIAEREFAQLPVEIVGDGLAYQIVVREADHWFLDEIAVVAAERGRGLGTQLVTDIMTAARAAGMPVRLSVLHVNSAQRLYARLGFRVARVEHPRVKMEWP